ncbi:MAG: hypothetical protein IJI44_04325 [Erysipelotrichaceae bacterium]|nr:hypothetical protein [Erysipelotrichaceae bacterium]
MKKRYLIIIAVLVVAICVLSVYAFLFPKQTGKEESIDSEPVEEQNEENIKNETEIENEPVEEDEIQEATIQEDGGDIIITIPDDQESAGE